MLPESGFRQSRFDPSPHGWLDVTLRTIAIVAAILLAAVLFGVL